jgi:hypothetical protein
MFLLLAMSRNNCYTYCTGYRTLVKKLVVFIFFGDKDFHLTCGRSFWQVQSCRLGVSVIRVEVHHIILMSVWLQIAPQRRSIERECA